MSMEADIHGAITKRALLASKDSSTVCLKI